jgi:hypothetical protein
MLHDMPAVKNKINTKEHAMRSLPFAKIKMPRGMAIMDSSTDPFVARTTNNGHWQGCPLACIWHA